MYAHLFDIWHCCYPVDWLTRFPIRRPSLRTHWWEEMVLIGSHKLMIERVLEVCRRFADDGKLTAPVVARRSRQSLRRCHCS